VVLLIACANYSFASPGYFATIGTPLLHGQDFNNADTLNSVPVTIITSGMAKKYFHSDDPIGKQVGIGSPKIPLRMIVGVVADIKHASLREEPDPEMFVPFTQNEIKTWPSMQAMQFAVRTKIDSTGTHYAFAHLDRKTASLSFRLDYTASTTLTLQAYASPFVSKGHYSNVRELANPRADQYDSRYRAYSGITPGDFNFKEFNSNLVLRWEYRPGSTLFVVWSQGRDDFEPTMGTRSFRGDFGRLFNAYPRNTFLVKMSYWLSR